MAQIVEGEIPGVTANASLKLSTGTWFDCRFHNFRGACARGGTCSRPIIGQTRDVGTVVAAGAEGGDRVKEDAEAEARAVQGAGSGAVEQLHGAERQRHDKEDKAE